MAFSGLLVCSALAGGRERGRPIEFSEPRSDEVTTNLHQLTSKKDGLKQLEEDLYKPLQSFAPKDSLEGVTAPPPRTRPAPVIQSKRAKELLERRKNWEFMNPEDLMAAPTLEDILKTPKLETVKQPDKDLQPLERYYMNLAGKKALAKTPDPSKDADLFGPASKAKPRDQQGSSDDSDLPSGIRESALALQQMFQQGSADDPFVRDVGRGTPADPFGLGTVALSKDQVSQHEKLMNEYHATIDPSWHPPTIESAANPAAGLAEAAQPAKNPVPGLGGDSSLAPRKGLEAQWDITSPILGPAGLPDVNAKALGQTRPPPPVMKYEPPKVVAPTVTAPKRAF